MPGGVTRAREFYLNRAWLRACDAFLAGRDELEVDDVERLAISAHLVGRDAESDAAWGLAHRRHLDEGDLDGASRCAFWLGFRLVNASEQAQANAWIARLYRVVAAAPKASVAGARLDYLTGLRSAFDSDFETAASDLQRAVATATRHGDEELAALARLSLGRVRIFLGDIKTGVRLLDDAMHVVRTEPISPIAVGDSYCTAIGACRDLYDLRRGQAWTDGLTRWCDQQTDLVPFAGLCLVHRAEFLQLKGAWVEAMAQAGLAKERLDRPFRQPAYGAAIYQQGELHRLLGEFKKAEACYRTASGAGRDPQPGLALLRLRQGRVNDAAQSIDRALFEASGPVDRSPVLAAYVEIMLASDRTAEAKAAASELADVAVALGSTMLTAVALDADGRISLAEGDARSALIALRKASDGFREVEAPYEMACAALLIGTARAALGDTEGAGLAFVTARTTYERLGARADLRRVPGQAGAGLTGRELQVLRMVAQGDTNRSIGSALGLSERTVDRHVSNIFAKLGVSSRAAATAAAHRSELI